MNRDAIRLAAAAGLAAAALAACTKQAWSTPRYVHKPSPDGRQAFKMGDVVVTNDELARGVEQDLYDAMMRVYGLKESRMKMILSKRIMDADPKKEGLTDQEYLDRHVSRGASVSDQEVAAFLEERGVPKESVNDATRARARDILLGTKRRDAMDRWLAERSAETPIEVYFEKPERPVFGVRTDDAPAVGGTGAKVVVAVFSDFQCPFCARGAERLEEIREKYGDRVRIAFKNFPLPSHADSPLAAEGGLCVRELEGDRVFWRYHDLLFANQDDLARARLVAHARAAGVGEEGFNECLDSGRHRARVESDKSEGMALGIRSTPTFFVNGKMIQGVRDMRTFSEVIDEELAR